MTLTQAEISQMQQKSTNQLINKTLKSSTLIHQNTKILEELVRVEYTCNAHNQQDRNQNMLRTTNQYGKNKQPNRKRAKGLTDTSQKQKSKWPITWDPNYEKALNLISHQENKNYMQYHYAPVQNN